MFEKQGNSKFLKLFRNLYKKVCISVNMTDFRLTNAKINDTLKYCF